MKIKSYEEAREILSKVDGYEVKNFTLTLSEDKEKDFDWREDDNTTLVGDALAAVEFYVGLFGNAEDGWKIALYDGQDDEEPYEVLGDSCLEVLRALREDWEGTGVYFFSEPEFGENGWAHKLILPNGRNR